MPARLSLREALWAAASGSQHRTAGRPGPQRVLSRWRLASPAQGERCEPGRFAGRQSFGVLKKPGGGLKLRLVWAALAGALLGGAAYAEIKVIGVQYQPDRVIPEYECIW